MSLRSIAAVARNSQRALELEREKAIPSQLAMRSPAFDFEDVRFAVIGDEATQSAFLSVIGKDDVPTIFARFYDVDGADFFAAWLQLLFKNDVEDDKMLP